jgi:hypothetical protein
LSQFNKSCYCAIPYTEGFEYGLKMRDKLNNNNIEQQENVNQYQPNSIEWNAFLDGVRDAIFTAYAHQLL